MGQKKGSKGRTARRLKRLTQQALPGIKIDPRPKAAQEMMYLREFNGYKIRIIVINGEPWWVLVDVAVVLGYRDAANAARLLRDHHKGTHLVSTLGGPQEMTVISEAGLYRLMMRSEQPDAELFQDWVTDVVLPSLRKTGSYSVDKHVERYRRKFGMTKLEAEQRNRQVGVHKDVHERMKDEGAKQPDFWRYHIALSEGQFGDGKTPKYWRDRIGIDSHDCHLDHMALHPLTINILAKVETEKKVGALPDSVDAKTRLAIRNRLGYETARQISHDSLNRLGPDSHFDVIEHQTRGRIIDVVDASLALEDQGDSLPNG